MDHTAIVTIIAGISSAPLLLVYRILNSKPAMGTSMLVGLGSAVFSVLCFWLWQWSQVPVLAYLDAIVYGFLTLLAPLSALSRWLSLRNEQRMAGS